MIIQRTVAVIGGSGFGEKLRGQTKEISTPFGDVSVLISEHAGKRVVAIQRHGKGHTTPPHRVNYRGNIHAAREHGAEAIFASTAVGVIRRTLLRRIVNAMSALMDSEGKEALHALINNYSAGDLILPRDFIAFQLKYPEGTGPVTVFDDFSTGNHHTDFTSPFSEELRCILQRAAKLENIQLKTGAILTATYGPRYESPVEIRALRKLGVDLVGMTSVFEAIHAHELGIPYMPVAIGTNLAAGLGKGLSHAEVIEMMGKRGEDVNHLLLRAISIL